MRVCTKCKQELDESYFNINKARKDGLTTWCKTCQNEYNAKRKLKTKITVTHKICTSCKQDLDIKQFNLCLSNVDGHEARCRYCQNNSNAKLKYYQERRTETKPIITHKICSNCKQDLDIENFHVNKNTRDGYNAWCRFCQSEYGKSYYKNTLESRKEIRKEHNRKSYIRSCEDPMLKLNNNMTRNIYMALKSNKAEQHWEDLVGYTLQDLKEHLEKQFDDNMNWDNQGSYWELDHIIPKNQFSYTSSDDHNFKICWSLMNLRPLSRDDNIHRPRKGQDVPEELKQQILNQQV
nr:HNH endonuclease [uncultured phage]CAI9752181.1 HNH endonuclease [uncultured phage]